MIPLARMALAALAGLLFTHQPARAERTCAQPAMAAGVAATVTTTLRYTAADGTCLQAFEWRPAAAPVRGIVIVVHGLRDHANRYGTLVQALAAQGLVVQAQDMRGHGQSGGDIQRFDSLEQLADDLQLGVDDARRRHPDQPVFLYGHSLGGLLVAHYAITRAAGLQGVVLSAPFLQLLPSVNGVQRLAARLLGVVWCRRWLPPTRPCARCPARTTT